MHFLHLSTGILDHSSFANCSRYLRFEGCPLPTSVLRSLHRRSLGFRSRLIACHFRTLQHFVLNYFCEVCFGSLSCWKSHVLTETQLSDTGPYIALQNSLVVFRFHDALPTVKASGARSSKATPKHLWTTMFDPRDRVLFFEGLISFSALLWSHLSTWRSPRRILAFSGKFLANTSLAFLCPCQQWGPPGSPTIASHLIQMQTDTASWHCELTLLYPVSAGQLEIVWKLIDVLYPPFKQSFVTIFHKCFSSVHNFLMTLLTVDTGKSRSLEIVHAFPQFWFSNPQTILYSSFFSSMLSMVHTDTQHRLSQLFSMQVWFLYYQHLLLATGKFKCKLKEHHMLEKQFFQIVRNNCK